MRHRLIITAISIIFYFYADVTQQLLSFFSCPLVRARATPHTVAVGVQQHGDAQRLIFVSVVMRQPLCAQIDSLAEAYGGNAQAVGQYWSSDPNIQVRPRLARKLPAP